MKKLVQILSVISVLLVLSLAAFGQKATRIKFAKGATSTIISGSLNGYRDKKVFLIRVRKGQTLKTEQIDGRNSSRYITITVESPSGEDVSDPDASCNNRKTVSPTERGDYRLTVVECQKADRWRGTFKFKVSVR